MILIENWWIDVPNKPLRANPHGVANIETPSSAFVEFATTDRYSGKGILFFDKTSIALVLLSREPDGLLHSKFSSLQFSLTVLASTSLPL